MEALTHVTHVNSKLKEPVVYMGCIMYVPKPPFISGIEFIRSNIRFFLLLYPGFVAGYGDERRSWTASGSG